MSRSPTPVHYRPRPSKLAVDAYPLLLMPRAATSSEKAWHSLNQRIIACRRCPRLIAHCRKVAQEKRKAFAHETYWGKPVPNFGDPAAELLIVGLAPAAHGGNRTGRVFPGDRSGD